MRLPADPRSILGTFAVIATISLSSPGVRAVRADEATAGGVPVETHGQVCEPVSPEAATAKAEAILDRIRMQAALEPVDPTADVVVLNNRGYNYAPTQGLVSPPVPGAE